MSVKIRLTRTGKTHQVSYRIVAQDTHSKRDGRFLDILGFYNPHNKPVLRLNQDKLNGWMKNGALPTPAVSQLITAGKLIQKPKKKVAKEEQKTEAAQQATEKPAEEPKKEKAPEAKSEGAKTDQTLNPSG